MRSTKAQWGSLLLKGRKEWFLGTSNYMSRYNTHFILKCLAWSGCSEIVGYYYWHVWFPSLVSLQFPFF